jgi:Na+/melibiose symporter-like transporter
MTDSSPQEAPARGSVGELLGEVTRDLSTLLRQEIELAKAELRQSAQQATKGGSMFAGAAMAGHMVLLFLSVSLWWALGNAMGWGWSALVVAALWLVIGAVLFVAGRTETRRVRGMPRTAETVKKIPNAVQGHEERNS